MGFSDDLVRETLTVCHVKLINEKACR